MTEIARAQNVPIVVFSEEDLMLGSSEHNHPLYVTTESDDTFINRILIDPGSSMNLMSLQVLKRLSLDVQYLGREKLMVHRFNENGQKFLGCFVLALKFGELYTKTKIHIIDANTLFRILLGRPWIYKYEIVPFTMHQCMKYLKDGEEW